jgi:F-type H+-transporting ATPase subunit b
MQIDWLTVAAQIVNFLVLVWLLQRFLYRPITHGHGAAGRAHRNPAVRGEGRARRGRGRGRASARAAAGAGGQPGGDAARRPPGGRRLRARLEDDIREEMEARRKTWQDHLEDERDAFANRLRQRAGHQVIDIVGRVLRDYAGSDLAGRWPAPSRTASPLDADARDKLVAAAEPRTGPARVESSVALKPGARTQITRAIHDSIAPISRSSIARTTICSWACA